MTSALQCPGCRSVDVEVRRRAMWGDSDLVRCATCGTEFLAPQPDDARLAEIYGADYYAPWDAESGDTVDLMKRTTFEPMLDACRPAPGRTLLDLGCATGSFLAEAAERGMTVYGVDLNGEAITRAQQLVPSANLHAGVLRDGPFPGVRFDAVSMIDFIEHVRDPEAELQAVHDVSHAGTRVVISTPRVDSLLRSVARSRWPQYREEHLTFFSRAGIRALLRRVGFSVESVTSTRKAITLAYAHGQAIAYPVPVISAATSAASRAAGPLRHRIVRVGLGEMTVVARRDGA
jgi:2-polyprenyl-3-methyl-5-hydroxy-6-metoxy-1,4-benzoquinol methylase